MGKSQQELIEDFNREKYTLKCRVIEYLKEEKNKLYNFFKNLLKRIK